MDYTLQVGDISLYPPRNIGGKIVTYLMRSPTLLQDLLYIVAGLIDKSFKPVNSPYYHVTMAVPTDENPLRVAEQEKKVQYVNWNKDRQQIIFRRKDLTNQDKFLLNQAAADDLGKGYDILNILGKTLTWLTGIGFFAETFHTKGRAICDSRVTKWIRGVINEDWGGVSDNSMTTLIMYEWLLNNNNYEIVYIKIEEN